MPVKQNDPRTAGRNIAADILKADPKNGIYRVEDLAIAYEQHGCTHEHAAMAQGLRDGLADRPQSPPKRVVTARLNPDDYLAAQKHLTANGHTFTSLVDDAVQSYLTQHNLTPTEQQS